MRGRRSKLFVLVCKRIFLVIIVGVVWRHRVGGTGRAKKTLDFSFITQPNLHSPFPLGNVEKLLVKKLLVFSKKFKTEMVF